MISKATIDTVFEKGMFYTDLVTQCLLNIRTEENEVKESVEDLKDKEKEFIKFDKSKIDKSEETKKDETKNIEVIKEYYENGNLKSEINKSFSLLSEATKTAFAEMSEKLTKETEKSKYLEDSSNHYYKSLEHEKTKTKDYAMKLKAKETFTWQMFFVGVVLGVFLLPIFRWIWYWVKRFQPYLNFVEWIKNFKK